MDKEWEPVKVALTVLSGRHLQSKKKGEVCNASVVFGLGKELYQTEEVKSSEPEWNQEASITVSGKPNESLKFKLRDQGHTVGVVNIPLSSLTRLRQDVWYPLQPYKKDKEVHGELLLNCAVVEWRPLCQDSSSVGSIEESTDKKKGPFHHIRHRRTLSGGKVKPSPSLESEGGLHVHWGSEEPHGGGNSGSDRSSGNQAQDDGGQRNGVADSESISRGSSGDEDENPLMPEVTGISPSEGSLEGGERVTLRGSNLGKSRVDVVRVVLAGVDCTRTMEYFSSGKLIVTTLPHSSPVSGPVLVETVQGGEGVSSIHFSYLNRSPRPSVDSSSSPLLPKKKAGKVLSLPGQADHERIELLTEVKALKQQIRELKDTNAELAEENSSLRCYMEKLLNAVINYSPEILEIAPSE